MSEADYIAAFCDALFEDYAQIKEDRGVEPIAISEADFTEASMRCDYAAWSGFHDNGEPLVARLIDPIALVPDVHDLGKDVPVRRVIARDSKGRFWSLAAADDVSVRALLSHLDRIGN